MSAAEEQNGSGPGAGSVDLAALRRCGRSLPVRHLAELGEAFEQRHYMRDVIVLCCAEVAEPDPGVDDPYVDDVECLGCRDCFRFCPDCVREAVRFGADAGLVAPAVGALQ